MGFKLKRIEAPVNKLIWHDIQQIEFKFKLPLLINRRGEVLLGNCQKQHVLKKQFQDVVVVQIDDYMKKVLSEIEIVVVIIFLSETALEIIIETLILPLTHKLVRKYRQLNE